MPQTFCFCLRLDLLVLQTLAIIDFGVQVLEKGPVWLSSGSASMSALSSRREFSIAKEHAMRIFRIGRLIGAVRERVVCFFDHVLAKRRIVLGDLHPKFVQTTARFTLLFVAIKCERFARAFKAKFCHYRRIEGRLDVRRTKSVDVGRVIALTTKMPNFFASNLRLHKFRSSKSTKALARAFKRSMMATIARAPSTGGRHTNLHATNRTLESSLPSISVAGCDNRRWGRVAASRVARGDRALLCCDGARALRTRAKLNWHILRAH